VKAGVAEASDGGHLGLLFFSQVLTHPLLLVRTNRSLCGKDFLRKKTVCARLFSLSVPHPLAWLHVAAF